MGGMQSGYWTDGTTLGTGIELNVLLKKKQGTADARLQIKHKVLE